MSFVYIITILKYVLKKSKKGKIFKENLWRIRIMRNKFGKLWTTKTSGPRKGKDQKFKKK